MTSTQQMMDNKLVLTLSGRFDFQARKPFEKAIRQVQATHHRDIILNFAQVPFIDTTGLGLLVLAHKKLLLTHQHLILVAPQKQVVHVFELTNFHKMVPFGATEQEARKNLASV